MNLIKLNPIVLVLTFRQHKHSKSSVAATHADILSQFKAVGSVDI